MTGNVAGSIRDSRVDGNVGGVYANSPQVSGSVGGNFIVGDLVIGSDAQGRSVPVDLRSEVPSWVTARRVTWLAVIADVLGVGSVLVAALSPIVDWTEWKYLLSSSALEILADTISRGWWLFALALVFLVLGGWLSFYYAPRRWRRWPEITGKHSLRRSLYPTRKGRSFVRAHAHALCSECREDSRPKVYARVFKSGGKTYMKCVNRHLKEFRPLSILSDL